MTETERTLVLVKPDGVQRGLVGVILGRLEARGLKLVGLKLLQVDEALAKAPLRCSPGQALLRRPAPAHYLRPRCGRRGGGRERR